MPLSKYDTNIFHFFFEIHAFLIKKKFLLWGERGEGGGEGGGYNEMKTLYNQLKTIEKHKLKTIKPTGIDQALWSGIRDESINELI